MRPLWIIVFTSLVASCSSGFKATEDAAPAREGGSEAAAADLGADLLPAGCPGAVKSEDVDTKHEPGSYASIAVEADGTIHVSHIATGPTPGPMGGDWHDARYSVRRGGVWTSEDIYTPGVLGQFTALGVGPGGKVHVVFYSYSTRDLVYAWRGSQSWTTEVIKTPSSDGWGSDLAVDDAGAVHVVTFKGASGTNDGQWLYLRRVGTTWDSPVVLQTMAGGNGPKSGIAAAADDTVHISFTDADGKLKYRSGKDGVFGQAQTLDTGLGPSCSSDLAVDGLGQVHISYFDSAQKRLRYVGQVGGIFGSPRDLDSAGTVGSYNTVAATAKGDLWVGYYDFTNEDLKVIRRQSGSWGMPVIVDSAGHVGRQVSAALGPGGALHLSHWNVSVKALRHTRVCP